MPPAKAIERLRVEAARAAIESGEWSMEVVARRAGFGSSERMRRAFLKLTGQPPIALKTSARRQAKSLERQLGKQHGQGRAEQGRTIA